MMEGGGGAAGGSELSHDRHEEGKTRDEDVNFFERELEKMGWGPGEVGFVGGSEDGEGQLEEGDRPSEEFKEWTRGPLV